MNILFVTWDGPQVNYVESLFAPIFARLQAIHGMRFHVLQFTWADAERTTRTRAACAALGVGYQSVRVQRWPRSIGALATVLRGIPAIRAASRALSIDVLMPRSTFPALAVLLGGTGGRAVAFDADGLALDERVDFAGESAGSLQQRILRDAEAQLLRKAAVVTTRTAFAANVLRARAGAGTPESRFHVVANGRDASRFQPFDASARAQARARLGIDIDAPLVAYAGSLGPQYRPEAMFRWFASVHRRRAEARMLVLTPQDAYARALLAQSGIPVGVVTVQSVEADAVPASLACADVGLALREPTFSMGGVAPIKLGEYLLCGLPAVATAGVGDTADMTPDVAFLLDGDPSRAEAAAVDWFVGSVLPDREGFRARCRAFGAARFSLDACVEGYARALRAIVPAQGDADDL
jgi:hypothetical protein